MVDGNQQIVLPGDVHHALLQLVVLYLGAFVVPELPNDKDRSVVCTQRHSSAILIRSKAVYVFPVEAGQGQLAQLQIPNRQCLVARPNNLVSILAYHEVSGPQRNTDQMSNLLARLHIKHSQTVVGEVRKYIFAIS